MARNSTAGFAVDNGPEIGARCNCSEKGIPALVAEPTLDFPYRRIRHPLALNLFKHVVLGERHKPGDPQVDEIRAAFLARGLAERLDWRTWSSWFRPDAPTAKRKSLEELDRLIDSHRDHKRYLDCPDAAPTGAFFGELVGGGLVRELLLKTSSKQPLAVLQQRAAEYLPQSSWHLHIDALETLAMFVGNGDIAWQVVKRIAAQRILALLHHRWGPRYGYIYKDLSSDLKILWDLANEEQREAIADFYSASVLSR
jgi:hypothetical protein